MPNPNRVSAQCITSLVLRLFAATYETISKAAVTAVAAQSFALTGASAAGVNASQAERTISEYKKGELVCFGCKGPHLWSKKQADDSYVVSCPNKDKPGVQAAAKAKIDDIRIKRKAKKDVYNKAKKAKTSANAAFEALSDEQKASCIADATRRTSTATTTTPASGSSAGSSNRQVFVVTVEAFAADTHRQAMPISIQSNLPHIIFSLGASLDDADCPDIRCALDTCA